LVAASLIVAAPQPKVMLIIPRSEFGLADAADWYTFKNFAA
jgi:hypothetical protein